MILKFLKAFCIFFISFNLIVSTSSAEIIKSIEIRGNERISNETIGYMWSLLRYKRGNLVMHKTINYLNNRLELEQPRWLPDLKEA